jgi:hypothetical protein
MYGNVVFNPSMGGLGYRGPGGVPGTPVTKTGNVKPGVKFHTPRSAGAQMLPGKMQAAARSATASIAARGGPGPSRVGPRARKGLGQYDRVNAARRAREAKPKGIVNTNMAKTGKMSMKSKLGIGVGLGIAAGVVMNRRGEGASSGRQSIYNY